jgi:hypothetical protein
MSPRVLSRLRAICGALPGVREEVAWVGIRWVIGHHNFAHVLDIAGGRPRLYARAADTLGPATVLTFRAAGSLADTLRTTGGRFFHAPWGTLWGAQVIGMILDARVDWDEVELLVTESYRLLAPAGRARSSRGATAG